MGRVLVVDDETSILASFQRMLTSQGHEVLAERRAEMALARLEEFDPEVVLLDIRMPGMNGLEAFRHIHKLRPRLPVIVMTGYGTTDSAIEATKLGAFEYVIKPFDAPALLRLIDRALECVRLMAGQVTLSGAPDMPSGEAIIGLTPAMQELYKSIGRVSNTDATVLIRGETGTGKELVARAVYQHSQRSEAPLLLLNCAAIPETLLENELFGHEKGAFTGAESRRIGKLEQTSGGTVFLDEIGDIPLGIQVKILRVLQERRFERVGGTESIDVNIRILAATNRNLERAIAEGRFREDLYHRLKVVTIHVPPLRERRADIPLLADYFLDRFSRRLQVQRPIITDDAMKALQEHSWPGNVRELEHCLHRAAIFARGYPLRAADIRSLIEAPAGETAIPGGAPGAELGPEEEESLRAVVRNRLTTRPGDSAHRDMTDLLDRLLVSEALRLTQGNQTQAARLLGLTRPTLQAKMQRYNIRRETSIRDD